MFKYSHSLLALSALAFLSYGNIFGRDEYRSTEHNDQHASNATQRSQRNYLASPFANNSFQNQSEPTMFEQLTEYVEDNPRLFAVQTAAVAMAALAVAEKTNNSKDIITTAGNTVAQAAGTALIVQMCPQPLGEVNTISFMATDIVLQLAPQSSAFDALIKFCYLEGAKNYICSKFSGDSRMAQITRLSTRAAVSYAITSYIPSNKRNVFFER